MRSGCSKLRCTPRGSTLVLTWGAVPGRGYRTICTCTSSALGRRYELHAGAGGRQGNSGGTRPDLREVAGGGRRGGVVAAQPSMSAETPGPTSSWSVSVWRGAAAPGGGVRTAGGARWARRGAGGRSGSVLPPAHLADFEICDGDDREHRGDGKRDLRGGRIRAQRGDHASTPVAKYTKNGTESRAPLKSARKKRQ